MPFPFIAPLKPWIVKKLEKRESDPQASSTLSPFAMLTSGAVVVSGGKVEELFKTRAYGDAYHGCVITNTTDTSKLYQTGNTIVGYDLNGKEIAVLGEKNRRVSTPIIESIEINSNGGNNTLKVAEVKVRVFTLKQLEMFELFFLRPSMNVVLEYGWNVDIRNTGVLGPNIKNVTIQKHLFAKKNWTKYKSDYIDYFTDTKKVVDYIKVLEDTDGNYDFMLGRVTNFNYSPTQDGSYEVNIEISAGNELQLWPAYKSARNSSNTKKKDKKAVTNYKSFIEKVSSDLNIPELNTIFKDEKKWKDEFFNYGITNEKQKNTVVSKTPFLSFKAIIHIINNLKTIKNPAEGIQWETYSYKDEPIIPVNSNPYIISTNPYILIPGELPGIIVTKENKDNRIVVSTNDKDRQKCLINKKSFNLNNTKIFDFDNFKPIEKLSPIEIKSNVTNETIKVVPNTGNLLNIFFSYERFLEIVDVATSLSEIITPILQAIDDTMMGLTNLEIQKIDDGPSIGKLEIVDRKKQHPPPPPPSNGTNPIYKFKMGPKSSIIRNFSFDMQLSTLMQAQALYSTQLAIAKAKNKTNTAASKEIGNYISADLSYAPNADGYFSINDMEISLVDKMPIPTIEKTAEEEKEEVENLKEVIQGKYTKFLINGEIKNMVYQDSGLIQLYLLPKANANTLALTFLEITLGIDGLAGFSCGEYFNIEGIPEIYNKNGFFQILNIKQGLDENGWKTTLEAGFLLKNE